MRKINQVIHFQNMSIMSESVCNRLLLHRLAELSEILFFLINLKSNRRFFMPRILPFCVLARMLFISAFWTNLNFVFLAQLSLANEVEEIIVTGDLNSLPWEAVDSIFGFDKSILETPRSASTISEEMMDRFNMNDIDELVVVSPGSFTQSFFGVAGGLDVRGTPGETYFRGMRRLDNPGNYPTPIGASDRVDIVRGPASPIYGPAKIGGYLNFNPKSARVEETGALISETRGTMSYTTGSWDKRVLTAEIGGPTEFGDKDVGYYVYGEIEDSDSYYVNSPGVEQTLIQASFDMDFSENIRIQFGGMYHDYEGSQNAGWNRLTQELIDNGTYITGTAKPLDSDGDGRIAHQDFDINDDGFIDDLNPYGWWWFFSGNTEGVSGLPANNTFTLDDLSGFFNTDIMALENVGSTTLDPSVTLIAADDTLENEVSTLYFDVIFEAANGWTITNKIFYETYENLNENAYGFSQFHDTYAIEDKLIFSKTMEFETFEASFQLSPSIRFTDFTHGNDWINEYFHRRDLTMPSTALDARRLATQIDDDYAEYYIGEYTDLALGFMVDFVWDNGLSVMAGARYDTIDIKTRQPLDKILLATFASDNGCPDGSCVLLGADDEVSGTSWTFSASYEIGDTGLIPYVTLSEQATVIAGQGAEISVSAVLDGEAFDTSELTEVGIKGQILEEENLYFSLSIYEQERIDAGAQSITVNQAVKTEGTEFELRWAVNDSLFVGATYTDVEAVNLNTLADGERFSFWGIEDLPNVPAAALLGGQLGGPLSSAASGGRRAGMPKNIVSVYGTYLFDNGINISASVADVDAVPSGYSNSIMLPSYTLINASIGYETEQWSLTLTGKNLSDELYFRANFPNLFGSTIALPELPRHFVAKMEYRF